MGIVEDIVERLRSPVADLRPSEVSARFRVRPTGPSGYTVRTTHSIVDRFVVGSTVEKDARATRSGTPPTTPDSSPPRVGLLDSFSVAVRPQVSAREVDSRKPEPQSQTMDHRMELRQYAIGGDQEGKVGVTPTELAVITRPHHSLKGRLVAAIEDYIADGLNHHTAALIRQGILPR